MSLNSCLLGISAGFHDSSAALVSSTGQVIYAASEERFTRKKEIDIFPGILSTLPLNLQSKVVIKLPIYFCMRVHLRSLNYTCLSHP